LTWFRRLDQRSAACESACRWPRRPCWSAPAASRYPRIVAGIQILEAQWTHRGHLGDVVHAISEALRQEVGGDIRVTIISPGVTASDLAQTITDANTKALMDKFREVAIQPTAIAKAIAFAIEQPDDVDSSEIIVRPTASEY
jgi:hypothetical protein